MEIDPTNPVVALCAAGMALEADAAAAAELFARAWAAHRDDFEAAVAAHYVARHQPNEAETLAWNARAVSRAEAARAAGDARVDVLMASLYLNLGDGLLAAGRPDGARDAANRAEAALVALTDDGYAAFVARGIADLRKRIA